MFTLRRPITVLAVLLASGGLAACGSHRDESARIQHIENEGLYLSLGELKYQVQGSRQLNPYDGQDANYLRGVPESERELKADEVWFAVFLQIENESDEPLAPAGDLEIVDTQDEVFKPTPLDDTNVFAYRPAEKIPAGAFSPLPDTPAYDTPVRGSLLLFKLKLSALDNRPLELHVEGSPGGQTGIIDLDV